MNLKPLGDRVVLRQKEAEMQTESGLYMPETEQEKPLEAIVVAVGPGAVEDGKRIEMDVKVGDSVIYSKYSGTEIKIGSEEYLIVKQDDILAILE
ncbi:MAG: co-chaperone GroES [Eubacteriaceae bacterium]|nr:co-chaperone GroES [Eubacteriaceae bacterium]